MTDAAKALHEMNVEDAIDKLINPMGNVIEVVKIANCSLYGLRFKNGGHLPDDPYNLRTGKWTKPELAIADAQKYLRDIWKISEESKSKGKSKDA